MLKARPPAICVDKLSHVFLAEIGVALTSFGGLFMLLGVVLFFDGSLLALGNVTRARLSHKQMTEAKLLLADPLPERNNADHWTSKNILFLRAEAEAARNSVFSGRRSPGIL